MSGDPANAVELPSPSTAPARSPILRGCAVEDSVMRYFRTRSALLRILRRFGE